jgi:hypothetical protein
MYVPAWLMPMKKTNVLMKRPHETTSRIAVTRRPYASWITDGDVGCAYEKQCADPEAAAAVERFERAQQLSFDVECLR